MIDSGNEPVEISMHFSPEDWTETSLAAVVSSYQDKVRAMGAPPKDVITQVERLGDGSVSVHVSWDRRGTVMDPMTGDEVSGGPFTEGSRPGLIMYTEEDGETFVELQDEHSIPPTGSVEMARGGEPAIYGKERAGVPWAWIVVVGAGLFAVARGIGWIRRKIHSKAKSHDAR